MRHDVAPRVTARARSGTGASASIAATTSSQDRSVFESPDAGARRIKGGEIQTETLPRKHKPDRLRRSWLPALKGASPAHGAAASPADISGADPATPAARPAFSRRGALGFGRLCRHPLSLTTRLDNEVLRDRNQERLLRDDFAGFEVVAGVRSRVSQKGSYLRDHTCGQGAIPKSPDGRRLCGAS